ncbi:MAG: hypothetical protein A2Y14_04565 [Verrucomicrobia bacterium GWF2_51_19]|nr:MAG: hypothetical protein A2Y14_04565 [Verrucomicrobia bacterium GWF2_51_19]
MSNLAFFEKTFLQFFVVSSHIAVVAIFISFTANRTTAERVRIATIATIVALLLFLFTAAFGLKLFESMNISLNAFKIAGSVILFIASMDLILGKLEENTMHSEKHFFDITIAPLAIPVIAGPACLTAVINLKSAAVNSTQHASVYLAIVLVEITLYIALYVAAKKIELFTPVVLRIGTRLSGFLLCAMAVQNFLAGCHGARLF